MKKLVLGKAPVMGLSAAVAAMLMSVCVTGVTQRAAFAQDPAPAATDADKKISLNFQNAPVQTVLKTLFTSVGANNSIDADVQGPVNVTMNNVTFDVALRSLLRAANPPLTYDLTDNVYHVRVKRRDTPAATYTAGGGGATTRTASTTTSSDKRWIKLPVDHMDVTLIVALGLLSDTKAYRLVPAYGTEVQSGNSNGGSGGSGGGSGGFGGGGGGFGGGGGGFGGGGGLGGGRGGLGGGQQAQLPEGVDQIIALQADNSLLIQATPEAFDRIRNIVKNIDVLPRQVQIKVEFITANVHDVDQFGINFTLAPYPGVSASSNLVNAGTAPSYSVGLVAGNLTAVIEGALQKARGKLIQSPMITTTNNVPALINIQQQIPYTTTTTVIPNGGAAVTNTTQQFLNVPTFLQVTPRINNDDTITLYLTPQISSVGPASITGGPPPVTTQNIQTLRTVRSGDTMVLGGFISTNETYTQQRIPLLGDLPLIGSLFRNRSKDAFTSELLIFVTPTILDANGYPTVIGGSSSSGSVTP